MPFLLFSFFAKIGKGTSKVAPVLSSANIQNMRIEDIEKLSKIIIRRDEKNDIFSSIVLPKQGEILQTENFWNYVQVDGKSEDGF